MLARRIPWILFAPFHFLAYGLAYTLFSLFTRPNQLPAGQVPSPIGYIIGWMVALSAFATLAPFLASLACMLFVRAPNVLTIIILAVLAGVLASIIPFTLIASWPNMGNFIDLILQNAFISVSIIGGYFVVKSIKENRPAA